MRCGPATQLSGRGPARLELRRRVFRRSSQPCAGLEAAWVAAPPRRSVHAVPSDSQHDRRPCLAALPQDSCRRQGPGPTRRRDPAPSSARPAVGAQRAPRRVRDRRQPKERGRSLLPHRVRAISQSAFPTTGAGPRTVRCAPWKPASPGIARNSMHVARRGRDCLPTTTHPSTRPAFPDRHTLASRASPRRRGAPAGRGGRSLRRPRDPSQLHQFLII
jgi:hypothetical protein